MELKSHFQCGRDKVSQGNLTETGFEMFVNTLMLAEHRFVRLKKLKETKSVILVLSKLQVVLFLR